MASLKTKLALAAAKAFRKAGDVAESVTYSQVTHTVNAEGDVVETPAEYSVSAIFDSIRSEQKALVDLVQGDMLMYFQARRVEFTPKLNDTVTRGENVYTVVGIAIDPASVLYTLQVRL